MVGVWKNRNGHNRFSEESARSLTLGVCSRGRELKALPSINLRSDKTLLSLPSPSNWSLHSCVGLQVAEVCDIEPRTPSHVHAMYWLVFFLARRKNNDAASTGQPEGREAGGSVKLRSAN